MIGTTKLKVIFWNCRSIRNKFMELFDYLVKNDIDICLLSETWLKHTNKLCNPTYVCIRKDREANAGGGVAILIKKCISYTMIPPISTEVIENIGIEIMSSDNKRIKVFSSYFSGGTNSLELKKKYKKDLRKLFNISGNFLFCGDFNSKHRNWGCVKANSWGNILNEFTTFFPITISHANQPTYVPTSNTFSPSNLDLVLSNIPMHLTQPIVLNEFTSDHLPVKFLLNLNFSHCENLELDYSKTNWSIYRRSIKNALYGLPKNVNDIVLTEDVDKNVEVFYESINTAIRSAVPLKVPKTNFLKLPYFIISLIRVRNYHRRQWGRYRQKSDYDLLTYYSAKIRNEIFKYRNESWKKKLSSIEKRSPPFWNICKLLRKKHTQIPPLQDDDKVVFLDDEKANLLAYKFLDYHKASVHLGTSQIENLVAQSIGKIDSQFLDTPESEFVTEEYVQDLIYETPLRKSAGHDDIKNIMIRYLPCEAVLYFTYVINSCIKLQYFPKAWKTAKIVPIWKPGKPNNIAESYRPISLLSSLSKIFEKVIKNKLFQFINANQLIPNEQFGFRQFHSTTHQIKRIANHVKISFENRKSTGLILLDIEKAFDSIWHDGLIHKLNRFNFPLYLVKLIKSFLTNRYYNVCLNNEYSDSIELPAGVPQGSVLSPLLYILYCSDFPKVENCQYAMYADDIGIFYSHEIGDEIVAKLERALRSISDYMHNWKIKLNAGKTQAIFFTRRRSPCYLPSTRLRLDTHQISWEESVKYLGVIFDKKLTYRDHVKYITEKVNIAIKMLYPLINRNSNLSKENKLVIYNSIFLSIILYACPAWGITAKSHIKKLQVCQNKVLKMMLGLPWDFSTRRLHIEANAIMVNEQIKKFTERFKIRCSISDNTLISNLYN